MPHGDVPVSPWVWQAGDYLGRTVTLTMPYDNTTRALQAATVVRQTGCLYGRAYFGLGSDGTPETSPKQVAIPPGTIIIAAATLAGVGLNTIEDVMALQFTVGP